MAHKKEPVVAAEDATKVEEAAVVDAKSVEKPNEVIGQQERR